MALQVGFLISGVQDSNGDPLNAGTVDFFTAGTESAKTIWQDNDKVSTATNPVVLDAAGKATIFAEGLYKIVIKDSGGTTLTTIDEVYFDQTLAGTADIDDGAVTLVKLASEVTDVLGGVKNQVRNGAFDFWSAGTSITGAPAVDICDGWFYDEDADSGTAVDTTISRNTVTIGGESIAERVPKYSMDIANADNGTSLGVSSYHQVSTRIYGVEKLQGETVTLSFDAKSDISKVVYVCAHQYFGSGGSPSTSVYTAGGRLTMTTAYGTRLSQSITIPSIGSKVLGSNDDDYLEIIVSLQHGATRASTIGDTTGALVYDTGTGYARLANFQVEIGSSDTAFELRPYLLDMIHSDPTGKIKIGNPTAPSAGQDDFAFGNTTGNHGMSITSATTGTGEISFDDTSTRRGVIQYNHNSDQLLFGTGNSTSVILDSSQRVLVGKTASGFGTAGTQIMQDGEFYMTRDNDTILSVNRLTGDGNLVGFAQDGTTEGTISVSGTTVSYNGFCGGHWGQPGTGYNIPLDTPRGTILSSVDELCKWKEGRFKLDDKDLKEDYYGDLSVGNKYSKKLNKHKVIKDHNLKDIELVEEVEVEATIHESTKENYVKVKICDADECKRTYGIYAGLDDEGDIIVHSAGASVVRVQGPIKAGELIQASSIDGVGKVQSDDIVRSSTLAVCNMGNDSNEIVTVPCSFMKG